MTLCEDRELSGSGGPKGDSDDPRIRVFLHPEVIAPEFRVLAVCLPTFSHISERSVSPGRLATPSHSNVMLLFLDGSKPPQSTVLSLHREPSKGQPAGKWSWQPVAERQVEQPMAEPCVSAKNTPGLPHQERSGHASPGRQTSGHPKALNQFCSL